MIYLIVLIGSLVGIVVILGLRLVLQSRAVRRFVRSMHARLRSANDRGAFTHEAPSQPIKRKDPRSSAIDMQKVRSLLREAEKKLAQNNIAETEKLLIQALTIQPDALDVQAELAKLYLTTEREAKAVALYKALTEQRDEVSFYANLGLAYYKLGSYIDACHAYQEALNRDPADPLRSADLGRACIAAQRYEEAAALLEKACERLARDTSLLHLLAECYLQIDDIEKAEETYRRINRLEPYDEEVKKKLSKLSSL